MHLLNDYFYPFTILIMTKKELIQQIMEQINETTIDGANDRIKKADRRDFEFLINGLDLKFNYRENSTDSDYRGEIYITYHLFIDENEKYRTDILLDMDYDFNNNNIDELADEIMYFYDKSTHILSKLNKTND